jgi:hypothetical protein
LFALGIFPCCEAKQPAGKASEKASAKPVAAPASTKEGPSSPPAPAVVAPAAEIKLGPNLLPNGNFEKWAPQERAPWPWSHGWGYPTVEEMPSIVKAYHEGPIVVQEGAFALEQTWKRSDVPDSVTALLSNKASGLEPKSAYRLSFMAWNQSKSTGGVQVWSSQDPNNMVCLLRIEVLPSDAFKTYSGDFTVNKEKEVTLSVGNAGPEFPSTIVWDDFKIQKIETPAPDAKPSAH